MALIEHAGGGGERPAAAEQGAHQALPVSFDSARPASAHSGEGAAGLDWIMNALLDLATIQQLRSSVGSPAPLFVCNTQILGRERLRSNVSPAA